MEDSGLKSEEDSSKVESVSLSQIFEEQCPIYMSYGMSYDEYWFASPNRAIFYRKAKEIKTNQKDEELWMQGAYIYDALCEASPILRSFSKKGTKPLPYDEKPYHLLNKDKNNDYKTEMEKEQEKKNAILLARVAFDRWARSTNKHFKKDVGGTKNENNTI